MSVVDDHRAPVVEYAVASRPRAGEVVSGDAAVVTGTGLVRLFAVVDALGHGPAAAETAAAAVEELRTFAGEDLSALAARCHARLAGTRGAAVAVARYDAADDSITWAGVGNVEGRLVGGGAPPSTAVSTLRVRPGTMGLELGPLDLETLPSRRGDVLVMATDGVDAHFADWMETTGSPQQVADEILTRHGRTTDDALVLVARLLGVTRSAEHVHDQH